MSAPAWQPDPEAELEFARRAGYGERQVERLRQMQQHEGEPQWSRVLRVALVSGGVQVLLGVQRDHHVPALQRYAVAVVAWPSVVLACNGFVRARRRLRRWRAGRTRTASATPR